MIIIRPELVEKLNEPDGLSTALQAAIELEHATIPTYLYAMYSLKPGSNTAISNLILSVVMEEMKHMALACNILNAIGGSPCIDTPGFIPKYPGPLPGSVDGGLIVPLAPFSLDLVKNVFMEIEEPEDALDFPDRKIIHTTAFTIGEFYGQIAQFIQQGGESLFTGNPAYQVTYPDLYWRDLIPVYHVEDALKAIDTIVEQGEGTTTAPMDPDHEPAHYYRYAEIYYGKTLVPVNDPPPGTPPDQLYEYSGPPIPFDLTGVYPTIESPSAANYPMGSAARNACDTFNYTYTGLLKVLHATFNANSGLLYTAIGMMESLQEQAAAMMAIELPDGVHTAGPSFEYRPTNP